MEIAASLRRHGLYIVGDLAYVIRSYLLTPYDNAEPETPSTSFCCPVKGTTQSVLLEKSTADGGGESFGSHWKVLCLITSTARLTQRSDCTTT